MRREAAVGAGLLAVVGLAVLLFWSSAPSVESSVDLERSAASDVGKRSGPRAAEAGQTSDEADADPLDEGLEPAGEEATDEAKKRIVGEPRALKQIRRRLRTLQKPADEPVIPAGIAPVEEDRLLVQPVRQKVKELELVALEVDTFESDDAADNARAQLMLAEAHTHMAEFMRERPVPSYLDEQGQDAAAAKAAAVELARDLPDSHPIRERLR